MRIDKFISDAGIASRRDSARAAKSGGITVDGAPVRDVSKHIDPEKSKVTYLGREIVYRKYNFTHVQHTELGCALKAAEKILNFRLILKTRVAKYGCLG